MSAPVSNTQLPAAEHLETLGATPSSHSNVIALVSVLPHRDLRGWPKSERGGRVSVLSLELALTRSYPTDAHLALYATVNGRRLSKAVVDHGIKPRLQAVAFDLDCEEVHGTTMPAPEAWRAAVREAFAELVRLHPGLFLYMTRGGARIVGRLDPTMIIGSHADARIWSQKYAIAVAYLRRRFGLICDSSCGDWTRLFRLPHATREGQHAPERWPVYGDASQIGALQIDFDQRDLDAAQRAQPQLFGTARTLEFAPLVSSGFGLLYHLLSPRGDLLREHEAAFVIRCPNERAHTTGRTGDGSTLLYAPAFGEEIGAIHCLHAHCSGMRVRDWLAMFDEHEIQSARRAAGIARAS